MFKWLNKNNKPPSESELSDDINRFNLSLRGASAEEIGMLLAIAAIIRLRYQEMGRIPRGMFERSRPRDEEECSISQTYLSNAVRQFQKLEQPSEAAGAMVWLHSARALSTPEVRHLGRDMWRELSRGFPFAQSKLKDIQDLTGQKLPRGVEDEVIFVPVGLEPDTIAYDALGLFSDIWPDGANFRSREIEIRASRYIQVHPDDAPIVRAILTTRNVFGESIKNAREVASMTLGRDLTDAEWTKFRLPWERVWDYLFHSN